MRIYRLKSLSISTHKWPGANWALSVQIKRVIYKDSEISTQKLGDGGDDGLLFVLAQLGEDGQGQDLSRRSLGLGEAALAVAEALQRRLQMERDGVVNLRADLALGQKSAQPVAAGGADNILMPDVMRAANLLRKDDAVDGIGAGFDQSSGAKERMIALSHGAAELIPAVDVAGLDGEDDALETVHARVPAHLVVVVAAAHSVLAQHAGALGQFVGIGGDHPRVARGAEVLGGIEAKGRGIAQGAGLHPLIICTPGLGGVFDEFEIADFGDVVEGSPVGALAIEVDGEDRANGCALRTIEEGFDGSRAEVEGGGVDVGKQRSGPGAENGARRGEEAEGGGDDGLAGAGVPTDGSWSVGWRADFGGGQRQPKGVCARGAADGVGHAQPLRCGFFKGGDGLAENELLRGQDLTESVQKFLMEGLILAFEVQHGHRLGGGGGAGRRIRLGFHTYMLAAAWLPRSQKQDRRSLNYSLR